MNQDFEFIPLPLLSNGIRDRSVLVGMPQSFNLLEALRNAKNIRLAIAFGHMSGWRKVESALVGSKAESVDVLLGQAFFQTEPELLYKLLNLSKGPATPKFRAKLASFDTIFHPKVWRISGHECAEAIVGSGNLSEGGLVGNVECGMYTKDAMAITALDQWFDSQWALGSDLERSHELYIRKYRDLEQFKKTLQSKMHAARNEIIDGEASWRRKDALARAIAYWNTTEGRAAVEQRRVAILRMRETLDFPTYNVTREGWNGFLRIPELGRVRLGHAEKTISNMGRIKGVLTDLKAGIISFEKAVDAFIDVPGIGRNLATKLLVVHSPADNVAFNEPIERALQSFGYFAPDRDFNGRVYRQLIKELRCFVEECEGVGMDCAAALDAFFYSYAQEQDLLPRHELRNRISEALVDRTPALLALVERQWFDQAKDELREGKLEIYFGTSSPGVSPAFRFAPEKVYFKLTDTTEVVACAEFTGVTDRNPSTKRLRGLENDARWKYYYGFRNLIKLERAIPLFDLRYLNGSPIPNNLRGSWVISDPCA